MTSGCVESRPRADILASLIGEPWVWQSWNCWELVRYVQETLFGRGLPEILVPEDFSRRWVIAELERHPERARWQPVPEGPAGLVMAADGALVLMAHLRFPAHVGVWLKPEGRVIHCDGKAGVACETTLALRVMGWRQLTFLEPKI